MGLCGLKNKLPPEKRSFIYVKILNVLLQRKSTKGLTHCKLLFCLESMYFCKRKNY